jgi:indolepyruvate ferredoxin oxidoreductase, beta subunit
MPRQNSVTNIVVAGLGGQGVITASDIIADAAFRHGLDVKKSELHGMSQRGGSVSSDVRFGERVFSPMVPTGHADFLLVLALDQAQPNAYRLRAGGKLISPDWMTDGALADHRSINVALIGCLSIFLTIPEPVWLEAIRANLPDKLHQANLQAFQIGRQQAKSVSAAGI